MHSFTNNTSAIFLGQELGCIIVFVMGCGKIGNSCGYKSLMLLTKMLYLNFDSTMSHSWSLTAFDYEKRIKLLNVNFSNSSPAGLQQQKIHCVQSELKGF